MAEHPHNENDSARADGHLRGPDAHGQAAMLLVESLIHGLIARSTLTVRDAVDIVAVATEVKEDVAADLGDSPANMEKSLNILRAVHDSLGNDLPAAEVRPWPPLS